jgi:hypothetical protein
VKKEKIIPAIPMKIEFSLSDVVFLSSAVRNMD